MLDRLSSTIVSVALNTAIGTTEEIPYGSYAHGMVLIPATASAITLLTWWVADKPGGSYLAAYDDVGVAVTQTVSHTKAYPIPVALSGARAIKAVVNAAGTVTVTLKG
jgi:hypothetical protein